MLIHSHKRAELSEKGWSLVEAAENTNFLSIASELGRAIPSRLGGSLVDSLRPKSQENSPKACMSAIHGLGRFPFHTDGAYLRTPPRFIVMRLAVGAMSRRCTLLQDSSDLRLSMEDLGTLEHDVWIVTGPRRPFLSSILTTDWHRRTRIIRYDPCCMTLAHRGFVRSRRLIESALEHTEPARIAWTAGWALIVDNWRILHGRDRSLVDDSATRCLERVWIAAE